MVMELTLCKVFACMYVILGITRLTISRGTIIVVCTYYYTRSKARNHIDR